MLQTSEPNNTLQLIYGSREVYYPWNACLRLPQAAEFKR